MAEALAKLADSLYSDASKPIAGSDLLLRLSSDSDSDSIAPGLHSLLLILKRAVESAADGKLGLQSWTDSQLQALYSLAYAVVSASRSLSVEQAEAIVVATVQMCVEFAVCYLERSDFGGDDMTIQNNMVQLLEISLVDGMDKAPEARTPFPLDSLADLSISVPGSSSGSEFDDHIKCGPQGVNCSRAEKPVDHLFMSLASECIQSDRQTTGFGGPTFHQDLNKLVFLSQHWAVAHVGCIQRLIVLCKQLIVLPDAFDEKSSGTSFCKRLSFTLRIIKLLGSLAKDIPYIEYDTSLVQAVGSLADALPRLFRPGFEFVSGHVPVEGSFESLSLLLLEDFIELVRVTFCNSSVFLNVQVCLIASILDNLDSSLWRYNNSAVNLKPPLAYFPRIVIYILMLIQDLKRQTNRAVNWKEFDTELIVSNASVLDSPSCLVHSEKVPLLQRYTFEELVKIIFPSSNQWMDNLLHLIFFLHSEGVKLRPKVERTYSSCAKTTSSSEVENVVCHEDEALFGDLFSESGRGSTDGYDQPSVVVNSSSSESNMPMEAATELLSFLKVCIFSPEWYPSFFEDSCTKLSKSHIDIFLYLLQGQGCSEDRSPECYSISQEERKIGQVHELCFDLLQDLVTRHALSDSLEEYFVGKILNVENDIFAYNSRTLTLLAHILFCRVGLAGSRLRDQILRGFVDYIIQKTKAISLQGSTFKELLEALPSVFHVEILLMAFHLSSGEEKASHANLIFSTLRAIGTPALGLNGAQLSCWALLISRLIVVLRHMLFYPQTFPSSLLVHMRSKLREAPHSSSPLGIKDNLSSWVSIVCTNVMSAWFEEEPDISSLLHHLIDISARPASLSTEVLSIDSLCLNWDDICSTMSSIIEVWKDKKAAVVEDLIVERYIFVLCWDFPTMGTSKHSQLPFWSDPQTLDISDMENFFYFSHSILGNHASGVVNTNFSDVIVHLLQHLDAEHIPEHIEELGWGFLRNAIWLSSAVGLLDVGICRYILKSTVPGVGANWMPNMSKDNQYITVAEGMVASLVVAGQLPSLFKIISSLLDKYLQVYQRAFIATFSNNLKDANGFSPLLLLKHSAFDICLRDELEKTGTGSFRLESVLDLLVKFDVIIDKQASGILCRTSWQNMYHGFPLNRQTPSGILLSCILNIRQIISILVGLLKVKDIMGNVCLESDVLRQILDSVVTIKFDRIFEGVNGKCEAMYDSLSAGLVGPEHSSLILLNHLERFLRDINSKGVSDRRIHECIMTKVVDTMDGLRKDPTKVDIFKLYLGMDDGSDQVKELFSLQRGDLLVLVDSLHNCHSEIVNVKVLGFFVDLMSGDLCPDLKQKMQTKFLSMDLLQLSKWLEKRLLGCVTEASDGANGAKGSPVSLRESTMNFILSLLSPPSDLQSVELQSHIFEAVLVSLDPAFLQFDIHVAKAFFHFVIQLSKGDASLKLLLKRTIMLMEKLAGNDSLLPGLKFLFGFLESVLSDCGSGRNTPERSIGKSLSGITQGVGPSASRQVGSRKNSETLVLSTNQEGGPIALECDATSLDEDEDDGTSDGEVASLDKDDEEDTNSDRALASKVCTFTSSGSNFMEQHWYFCYTCDLTVSKGCCSVCAKVCHRGHRVVYSRSSRFFCDCGAGGVRGSNCQCLKPRKFTGVSSGPVRSASNFQSFLPFAEDGEQQLPESDSDLDEDSADIDNSLRLCIPRELQDGIKPLLEELDVEGKVLELCSTLFPYITSKRDSILSKDSKISLGKDKVLSFGVDLLQLKKAYKSGSLDLKIKADYSNAKELKLHLASGSLVKSLLSVSIRGRLAVGEGDKVAIFDVGQLIGQATIAPVTADKTNVKPLSKNVVRFEIVHLTFNPVVENYLAVAGYEDCQVLTLNPRGEVTDRLAIELALQGAYIRRVDWVPGSQVQLMVVTNRFVKIYDLSQDNISPIHYFTLPDDKIVDATLLVASHGRTFLIVLSEHGRLLRLELSVDGNVGATPLKEVIQIQDREIAAKGSSLYFSSAYKLLFLSYQDGTTLVGRLNPDATSLSEVSSIYEDQDGKLRSAGLHRWKELLAGSGLFVCFSTIKLNSAIAVSMGADDLFAQNLRHAVGSTSPLVGVTAYKPLSKDKIHCLVLHDDGSLQIYSHAPVGVDTGASATAEKVKKLGSGILSNKAYAGVNPEFPLDFFERTLCITPDVKLGGDAIRNGDSEGAKQSLASEDGFLESPNPAGFKISVFNSNPDIIMVGFRVHVGNTSASHIPSDITIFHRVIKLDEGMRSWYDIPFTVAESLLADEEFTICVGPSFNGSALPRIDCLEVYGRAKDEFGWKEKMDAVLDMEARVLGCNSLLAGSAKKRRSMQSAPIQEQVIADGLKLLSRIYSLCRSQGCSRVEEVNLELSKLRCKHLLENIFESDREPLLQAAACRVLQAVYPKKDTYYNVKDAMRLSGVVKSTCVLSSRLGVGGTAGTWIVEEFTAQMRAVSKIALHRRSNLATFLEMNDLCPDLKQKMQTKFLSMDLLQLSKWLEKRLLGCVTEASDGANGAKGSPVSLRESTMNFILSLLSPPSDLQSVELQSHIFEAVLVSLDPAFLQFDIHVAKAFFHFVIQLSKGDASLKLLLKRTIMLMEKLAGNDSLLPGLKFLFGFLESVLSDCGSGRNTPERSIGKSLSGITQGVGPSASRQVGSRKNSETLVLSTNQEGGPIALECDATSLDEDEDDGTSDGEVASLDKDDEEDTNSDRALASKVCTFTSSGSNFMEQHWYFCYTCDLTVSKGCCSVCAKVCHRGHRVVYSRSSRFFCDCGAGGVRGSNCQCLKPRKFTGVSSGPVRSASNFQSFLPFAEDGEQQLPESDSDLDEDSADIDNSLRLCIPRELQDGIKPLLEELDVEGKVLELCSTLFPYITSKRDSILSKDSKISLGKDKVLSFGVDLLQLKKAYKSGSLDLKIKADYSNAKELKLHLASGSLVKSLLSVSIRGRLAVGEGDKVAIFDVGQLIGQATIAPVTADKTNVKPLSKNVVRFEIVHLTFNPVVENYLAVAGYEDCQVLTLNPRGEVTDRLAIELALQGAYIRRVDWVPGSQVQLMVVTNRFVKIYDLSQDNISPIHYFTLPDDKIVDATLLVASHGRTFLIVLSEHGRLLRLELSVDGNVGATPLKEVIQIQDREIAAKGSSLYFSSAYKLLFLSYQDGTTLVGRLNPDATSLSEVSSIYEDQDGKLRSAGLHRWKELLAGSGLFVCFSTIKLNSAIAVSMGADDLFAQNLRHAVGSTSPLVGVTAYKPLSKDKIHCLVLHDDGSLQIYSHAPVGVDTGASATAEKVKKLGSGILSNKAYAGVNPEFPLDFFERTLCITPDVKLGGDAIRNGDSEGAKQSLASEDGFLESPNPAGFKISVFNSNPDIIMVGFRVHVGNTSASHIPSDITIFHRVIKLDEGMRSWYDIPFTVAESLLADEEFTICVGPSFNGSALPRIDCLEVYGRAKDEFGWKEKMDAVLDMEARVLGCNSLLAGSAKKRRSMQSAPIQEQVIADGLKLLSRIYSLCRSQGCSRVEEVNLELSKLRCKHLLENIFESDREPLLQAAACRVLQAVYPKKDTYYNVKDAMRLSGVVKSTCVLSSRLGVGGTAGTWIVEEFTAQMRAVSKIALHRRSNLATFLEMNGSEVVDGLIQVLWGILDLEQLDTQTMNNIVISSVELIYCYAECLALHSKDTGLHSVGPAVLLFKKLLFSPNEAVQTSTSLAISSRLLQVPFPKQTMLATDDAAEIAISAPVHANTTGGNSQVMIEEDSITSSVQYCCDGCTTVPILRRRWHCTVCPDFDLCEACYEVLDADRLPPPHSRDHPMTAIPIEVESLGGDGNEFHFTPDDASDSTILPITADSRTQSSTPSIHVLEPSESGEFSASVNDPVSISASKRALNSLILSELLEQLKGWMHSTSGVRAIPVMQLFYRLSSAVGGPFIDISKPESLDLEKLIRWFLDELNLNQPFAGKSRSSFGEVAILVFMFFTLMLRNWHQPGSDSSIPKSSGTTDVHDKTVIQISSSTSAAGSSSLDDQEKNDFASQLLRACSSLRQQSVVNYLMDILQQLMQVFKSPSANYETAGPGSGCGALLTVRRDLAAGNFSPFFSDSYAKAHRTDIFMDYHRLLLENTFRLVYTLVRPEKQDKTGEKEKVSKVSSGKDLKLDGYQDVLCSYINNPHTTFIRRYARRLFLHLCGSKTHYYSVRDSWQFSSEMKKLFKHVNKSGGFQNPLSYERSVKIVKCLSTMAEVAAARPRNWQRYCLRHSDFLPFLINGLFYLGEESVIQILKLLNLSFYTGKDIGHSSQKNEAVDSGPNSNKSVTQSQDPKKKKKSEDGADSSIEKSYVDMESVIDIFSDKDGDVLKQFIDCFLLEWNSSSVRVEAKGVLYGVWHHAKQSFKEAMLMALLQKVKSLPMYGQNIVEYTELVTWFLGKVPDSSSKQNSSELVDRCLTPDVIKCIFETLHSQNELLANHPNSRIYNTLSGLVEFDGYYLESEPCVACSSPEVPYSRMKLESLKSETKFTDNRIIVKCTGSYTIQTVTMNVHDARKSKSVKVLNLYYNNRPVADLSELKNNWSLWKRAKSCHLAFNQTELKVDFPIPITACNFMIELDSFYENLQALSLEPLQCPRCSRPVTDKHGICSNCHENAYQCRQCRNINYENLDSFLCNECGYSKYGRFEFNFMAKPSFAFDDMENDEDMKRGLAAIETESENAHRRYQQLLGFKKPLLKIVSSVGENEIDSQQKDSVQQMMVSLPGPACKINRKIALLGVLYGEKCKAAFDSVSKSVQTLQGLRRVLMNYLHQKQSDNGMAASRFVVSRSPNNCYGCAITFVTQCLEILQVLSKHASSKRQLVGAGILTELFENNIHQGPKTARVQARAVLCAFSESDMTAVTELNSLIQKKVMYCLEHHRSMDIALATREELSLLSEVCSLADEFWESRLRVVFQLLFSSIKLGAKHPAISEHVILPCLRIISQACTPPKPDLPDKEPGTGKASTGSQIKDESNSNISGSMAGLGSGSKATSESLDKNWDASQKNQDIQLLSYSEWEKGASYLDFVRRQYKVSQAVKGGSQRPRPQRQDFLALKYALRWKRRSSKTTKNDLPAFELGSWVTELVLSACSQSIRSEMCMLISLLCAQSTSRRFRLLNLLVSLLPATLSAGESAAEYFESLFKMIESEDARLFLTVRGCLRTICKLITEEVGNVESLERSLHIDISQGFILHKLIEMLGKFLEVPNIRSRFMQDNLLSEILEALIVIRGLVVQKTKLISDCNRLLKDLLDSLLLESSENKRQFIRACIFGLQNHGEENKGRPCLFILEQLCNLICPSKPEPVYLLVLNKAHTQEEFIRGSMTKNPYSSSEIGPLMRDVKNKICHQLDLLGLLEDDYGMELLVAGNIISLDLTVALVYEQVWKKSNQSSNAMVNSTLLSPNAVSSARDSPPMAVTYRLQGLDGEATEPMIKELEEDREESQDPEVEFAIAGAVREYGGLEIILSMIQRLRENFKSNQEQLVAVLNLLMHCCKIRENRRALLRLGALGLLLETARRAFSVDAMEPAEGILLIVESLTLEANESDNINITQSALTVTSEETGEQAKKIVLMFLERLSHPSGLKKSNKQQRNTEMVARILPYLTYGEPAAMEALIQHFSPPLQDWREYDRLQEAHQENPKDDSIAQQAAKQRFTVENFVRVSESLKTSSCGERLKDIILERGITGVAVRHLRDSFSVTGEAVYKSSAEWAMGLKLPSVPLILSMLRGLSTGHLATQKCIDEGDILPLLHALEGVSGEYEIGARAENLLDTLANKEGKGDGFLEEKVRRLRHATRDEMRRRALRKREELLQGLGMWQELASDGGERIVVARPLLEGLEDVEEEEDGLACMVCREGYSLRPTDLLGVYSYSKRVNLGAGTSGSARGECVYTTVSYFNIIHFQCHQEAKRADAALKNPKKEWEGATLRNNESLCNSLFPVRGPSVPLSQYSRYVDHYWDNLNALGRADGSRLRLLTYDIVLMLARFATGASFSAECRGGGRESNSRFLPFMIQMARHLLDQGSSSQRHTMAKSVSTYLTSSALDTRPSTPGTQLSLGSEETVQFMMVNSLLSESHEAWLQHRRAFLQRGIYHAYMQHTHGRSAGRTSSSSSPIARIESGHASPSPSPESGGAEDLLNVVRPMLVYTGLIEQLQRFFKVKKPAANATLSARKEAGSSTAASQGEDDSGSLEGWEVVMKERLLNVSEMVEFSKELLSWLDEMSSASDLQEGFDIIGVLADVLSGGITQCEDFVRAAINAGRG